MMPMSSNEFIALANELMGGRALEVTKRTLRFYTSKGVVPSPTGSLKFARYGYPHLLSLLVTKALQDRGRQIRDIRESLEAIHRGEYDQAELEVDRWLAQRPPQSSSVGLGFVAERGAVYRTGSDSQENEFDALSGAIEVRRYRLTPHVTLEIEPGSSMDQAEELEDALAQLDRMVQAVKRGKSPSR